VSLDRKWWRIWKWSISWSRFWWFLFNRTISIWTISTSYLSSTKRYFSWFISW